MTVIVALLTYNILLFLTLALPAGKMINNNINSLKNETSGFSWNIRLFWVIVAIIIVAGTREYYVGVL